MDYRDRTERRFWAKVFKSDDCWNWIGHLSGGYGKLLVRRKMIAAHRYSWELHRGKIPDGLCVCHKCDNPACVKIDHLFVGTRKDNQRDMVQKNRGRTHYGKGESYIGAKLNDIKVRVIRAYYPTINTVKLAEIFGVCDVTISEIVRRVKWGHI